MPHLVHTTKYDAHLPSVPACSGAAAVFLAAPRTQCLLQQYSICLPRPRPCIFNLDTNHFLPARAAIQMPYASRRDQNIPVTAITGSVRDPQFTREEWDQVRTRAHGCVNPLQDF